MSKTIDVPRLQRVLDWALAEWLKGEDGGISEWCQGDWMTPTYYLYDDSVRVRAAVATGEVCGTSLCIAGKTVWDEGWRPYQGAYAWGKVQRNGEIGSVREIAKELLGLDDNEAEWLFSGDNNIYNVFSVAVDITAGEIQFPQELIERSRAA